jgi:hypothetical protein
MPSSFVPATREQILLRLLLTGPPGSGKTWCSLSFGQRLALALALELGVDVPIALIDSEHGRAAKYLGDRPTPDAPPFKFDICVLDQFSPAVYTNKIEEAGRSGYRILLVDGLAHAWGSLLDLHDSLGGNRFCNWSKVNPLHARFIESILESPCHVICTCRAKVKHILEDNKPKKVGVGIVQRPGTEYEFDLVGELDRSHVLTVTKSLCHEVENAVVASPTGAFMDPVISWLRSGKAGPVTAAKRRLLSADQLAILVRLATESGEDRDRTEAELLRRYGVREFADLKADQASDEIKRREKLVATRKPAAANVPAAPPAGAGNGLAGQSATPGPVPAAGGITEEQVGQLNQLCRDMAEHGLTKADFRAILARRGASRLAELTDAAAAELITKLRFQRTVKEMEKQAAADHQRFEEGGPVATGEEKSADTARPPAAP